MTDFEDGFEPGITERCINERETGSVVGVAVRMVLLSFSAQ